MGEVRRSVTGRGRGCGDVLREGRDFGYRLIETLGSTGFTQDREGQVYPFDSDVLPFSERPPVLSGVVSRTYLGLEKDGLTTRNFHDRVLLT